MDFTHIKVISTQLLICIIIGTILSSCSGSTGNKLQNNSSKNVGRITYKSHGLHGYLGYSPNDIPSEYALGVSFYTAIWPLVNPTPKDFQIGLIGTWIQPNNSDNKETPLCPEGTYARDHWEDERGPTFSGVFQTIEGSPGYWRGNKFHYDSPKFSMNSTPNCYNSEIASPGWPFFKGGKTLPDNKLGIAQLSNRIIVPPDGFTFEGGLNNAFLGYSWMALPFLAAKEGPTPTGNQSWTLFMNTSNFKGPVAFYLPEVFSRVSKGYEFDYGRGLDARSMALGGGLAIEINTVPSYAMKALNGKTYVKVPQLQFPVNDAGQSILAQGPTLYSKNTLFNCIKWWRDDGRPCGSSFSEHGGSFSPSLRIGANSTDISGTDITGISSGAAKKIFNPEIFSNAYGFQWNNNPITSDGKFPQYFVKTKKKAAPVKASDVPEKLRQKKFKKATESKKPYTSPKGGDWKNPGPAAGPFSVTLQDGSKVTYYWYRFVDQPSLQHLNLSKAERQKLQQLVEQIQSKWTIDKKYMAPPNKGKLVTIDNALVVTQPKGLEVGFVPIVTRQE